MLIFYCEKCSQRVKQEDLDSGHAVQTSEGIYLCSGCAPKTEEPAAAPPALPAKMQRASGANPVLATVPRRSVTASSRKEAVPAPARDAPRKSSSSMAVIGLSAAGVVMLVAGLVLFARRKSPERTGDSGETRQPAAARVEIAQRPADKPVDKPTDKPAPPAEKEKLAAAAPEQTPAKLMAERQKQAEKEMDDLRNQRAAKMLEEHKDAFARNALGPWMYQGKLRQIISSYRSTPAAAEAERILSELKLPDKVSGRFVRIDLPGEKRVLSLAEVQVISAGKNVAQKAKASQSTTDHGGDAGRAVDGNTTGVFGKGSVTHTREQTAPWWEVDLQNETEVNLITIFNRAECAERLQGFRVQVLNAERGTLWETTVGPIPSPSVTLEVGR